MTDTTADNVRILMGKFAECYEDSEIESFISVAKVMVAQQAPNADDAQEEILQRWLTAHLLIRRKGIEYTGRGVTNITAGQVSLNRSSPEELMRSNQLYDEYVKFIKMFANKIGSGKTKFATKPSNSWGNDVVSARDLL